MIRDVPLHPEIGQSRSIIVPSLLGPLIREPLNSAEIALADAKLADSLCPTYRDLMNDGYWIPRKL